jgi:prolyl oligopeptidase
MSPSFYVPTYASLALTLILTACAAPPTHDATRIKIVPSALSAAITPAIFPVAPVRPITETFFGQMVTDPYRYMENVKDPDVIAYMRAQGRAARTTLDAIPGRAALASRIATLAETGPIVSGVQAVFSNGQKLFYYKLMPGEAMRKLYVRDGLGGEERLLFDAQKLTTEKGGRWALDYFKASPDARYVIVGVAAGGSEETSLRLIEVASGRDTGVVIDRIGFADGTAWAPDSKSFFYNRLPPSTVGTKNRYLNSSAIRHIVGRPVAQDEVVFGPGAVNKITPLTFADIDIPHVELSGDGRTLLGRVEHGDLRDISLYVADAAQLPSPAWRKVVGITDAVTRYVVANDSVYVLSHKDAPRNKVLRLSLPRADLSNAVVVVPEGSAVLAEMALAQDALYVREMVGGVDRLQRMIFGVGATVPPRAEAVAVGTGLAIRQMIADPARPGVLLRVEGWTISPRYTLFDAASGKLNETNLQPISKVDFSQIEEMRVEVSTAAGAKVPLSLIYKRGMSKNGDNPTLVRAYGAYGITLSPTFSAANLAWLERGGVLATCHVRGGGEYGVDWHRAGQKLNKPNTWRDLIACSEYLIEQKFTRTAKLAIQGGSAGGITVGRALTERPDLFAAVVPSVGLLDALRAEFTPNGPPNIPEFGSVTTADGFKGLLAMSSFHQVKDDTKYPGVLLMHGVNDPRVEVWQSAKMVARLQAASAGVVNPVNGFANPVLLRLDYDAGHGVGSTRNQRNEELADVYSFALWQFKDPSFLPK